MSDVENLVDWLGQKYRPGDRVIYSSSSDRTGINIGIVERIDTATRYDYHRGEYEELRVKIRPEKSSNNFVSPEWAVTLLERNGAFRSITKWPTA